MKTIRILALLAMLVVCGTTGAVAQTTASASASATVTTSLALNVTNTTFSFGSLTSTDFDAGFKAAPTTSVISHRGNVRHTVSVAANAATFTGSNGTSSTDPVRANKPASDLLWSKDAFATAGNALSTSAAPVISQSARGRYDNAVTVAYRFLLSYAQDTPGDYALALTYTIAAD
ncbi:MAG TPA: hypothetical protein VD948_12440 [Rhodothermales bacterium]|nr:hypothetical protein [Rhodothermales bacterium]